MSLEKYGVRFQPNDAVTALTKVSEACSNLSDILSTRDPDARIVSVALEAKDLSSPSEGEEIWYRLKIVVDRTNEANLYEE